MSKLFSIKYAPEKKSGQDLFFASLKRRAEEIYQGERVFFCKNRRFYRKNTFALKKTFKGRFSSVARKIP
jgi:hypothetical protein